MEDWLKLIPAIVPALTGFVGIIIGAELTRRREAKARELAFRERQLREFYGPIRALILRDRVSGELVYDARNYVEKKIEEYKHNRQITDQLYTEKMSKVQDFHAKSLRDATEIWGQIAAHVQANLGLAEPSTIEKFPAVLRFIANRDFVKSTGLPLDYTGEWPPKYPPDDNAPANIGPFIEDVEQNYDELRSHLERGLVPHLSKTSTAASVRLPAKLDASKSEDTNLPLPVVTGLLGLLFTIISTGRLGFKEFSIGFLVGIVIVVFRTIGQRMTDSRQAY